MKRLRVTDAGLDCMWGIPICFPDISTWSSVLDAGVVLIFTAVIPVRSAAC